MIAQLSNNWICWAILLLALFCYQQLFAQYLQRNQMAETDKTTFNETTAILINALPLLGLFGTITGLLDCFSGLAAQGVKGELVSQGIADALLTTQLGLVCAIPGWLLQFSLRSACTYTSQAAAQTVAQE